MRLLSPCLAALLLFGSAEYVNAQSAEVVQAKAYFKAGASAYEMGDYLAAIQALESAYRLTPLPAIAFSLAQAERRQYFVARERAHLERAIELFRTYLQQVPSGGRRADAIDALGQLEPIAVANAPSPEREEETARERTRLMVSSATPRATIALDGAAPTASPLIAQVAPGPHRVVVTAPGFYPAERSVSAIAGELVPLEIELREQPAVVELRTEQEMDLQLDGALVGSVAGNKRIELPSGTHRFSFTKNGHRPQTIEAHLAPGTTRALAVDLPQTGQRVAAIALFIAGGVSIGASGVLTGLAVDRENDANDILARQSMGNISPADLDHYADATRDRDRLRVAAGVGFGTAAAALITGLFLYALDH